MASLYQIKMNYQAALRYADRLDALADQMRNNVTVRFEDSLSDIGMAWKGEAAGMYLNKGNTLNSTIRKNVNKLKNSAETVRKVATNIYNAELRAIELASMRSY